MSSLVFADPDNSQPRTHVQIDEEVSDFVCNFLDSVFVVLELAMKILSVNWRRSQCDLDAICHRDITELETSWSCEQFYENCSESQETLQLSRAQISLKSLLVSYDSSATIVQDKFVPKSNHVKQSVGKCLGPTALNKGEPENIFTKYRVVCESIGFR